MCGNTDIFYVEMPAIKVYDYHEDLQKQTLIVTASNYVEIPIIHEVSRECVWLKSMTQDINGHVVYSPIKKLQEDNVTCIAQLKRGYIK